MATSSDRFKNALTVSQRSWRLAGEVRKPKTSPAERYEMFEVNKSKKVEETDNQDCEQFSKTEPQINSTTRPPDGTKPDIIKDTVAIIEAATDVGPDRLQKILLTMAAQHYFDSGGRILIKLRDGVNSNYRRAREKASPIGHIQFPIGETDNPSVREEFVSSLKGAIERWGMSSGSACSHHIQFAAWLNETSGGSEGELLWLVTELFARILVDDARKGVAV